MNKNNKNLKSKNSEEEFDKTTSQPKKRGKNFNKSWPHNKKRDKTKGGDLSFRKGKQFNDISYYTKNPMITKAFASVPFNYILGNRITSPGITKVGIAGICSYNVDWMANDRCVNETQNSGETPSILEQVASIIYTQERRANAGSTNNIEPIDVLISNLLASIDIYCNATYANRMFGIANTFSWKNRMIPREIFNQMGFDYDEFIAHQANYRGRYNTIVAQAKTIRTLANFDFIKASLAEYSSIFKDEDTDTGREQIVFINKLFHHIYDPVGTTEHPGGMVRYMDMNDLFGVEAAKGAAIMTGYNYGAMSENKHVAFSVLLDIMQKQIDAIITDADFNTIQADIEKAFGEQSAYLELAPVDENQIIEPIYSGEFLTMLHNAVVYSNPASQALVNESHNNVLAGGINANTNTIFQYHLDNDVARSRIGFEAHYCVRATDYSSDTPLSMVDTNLDSPSPEDVVMMTRYKSFLDFTTEGIPTDMAPIATPPEGYRIKRAYHCTNFIMFFNCVTHYTDSLTHNVEYSRYSEFSNAVSQSNLVVLAAMLNFNWAPMMFVQTNGISYMLFQANNIKVLTTGELDSINLSCFLSLWDLPNRTNI